MKLVAGQNNKGDEKNRWKQKIGDIDYTRLIMNKNKSLIKDCNQNNQLQKSGKIDIFTTERIESINEKQDTEETTQKLKYGANTRSINKLSLYLNQMELETNNKILQGRVNSQNSLKMKSYSKTKQKKFSALYRENEKRLRKYSEKNLNEFYMSSKKQSVEDDSQNDSYSRKLN